MGVARNILGAWRRPRLVMARLLADGQREDRVLMYLMLGCVLLFVSRWPELARVARLDPDPPLNVRLAGALFGWLFIVPPGFYIIAAASRLIARMLGGKGSWYSARLALFWALLVSAPVWLLVGLVAGFGAPAAIQNTMGIVALAGFVVIWLSSLSQAEFDGDPR